MTAKSETEGTQETNFLVTEMKKTWVIKMKTHIFREKYTLMFSNNSNTI